MTEQRQQYKTQRLTTQRCTNCSMPVSDGFVVDGRVFCDLECWALWSGHRMEEELQRLEEEWNANRA